MDWFLYDNDLRHDRIKQSLYGYKPVWAVKHPELKRHLK